MGGVLILISGFSMPKPMINYILDDRVLVIIGGPDTISTDLFSFSRSGAKPELISWEHIINLAPTSDPKQVALFFWMATPTGDRQTQIKHLNATLASPDGTTVSERLETKSWMEMDQNCDSLSIARLERSSRRQRLDSWPQRGLDHSAISCWNVRTDLSSRESMSRTLTRLRGYSEVT
jgi:hypothetical protein